MKTMLTLLAVATTFGAPAFIQDAETAPAAIVHHADLDLTKPRDVRRLDHRIRTALDQVCGTPSSAAPSGTVNVARCRAETARVANPQREAAVAADRDGRRVTAINR